MIVVLAWLVAMVGWIVLAAVGGGEPKNNGRHHV
jgi:hypothetical protein